VSSGRDFVTRRSFLQAAAPFALGLGAIVRGQTVIERGRFNYNDIPLAQEQLLTMVNEERTRAGLNSLKLDELACKVAGEHAADMAKESFLSHWGSDGRKPYHRYSFAGGTDALQENVSTANDIQSVASNGVLRDLRDMHQSMIEEVPPYDGHRKTILFPYHTHVGFGVALYQNSVKLDELYLARYLHIDPVPRQAKPKSTVFLTGKLLNAKHFLNQVDVFYEALPAPPELAWLRTPRPVSLPDSYVTLRPKAPEGTWYRDGGKGDFEWNRDGKFRVPARLFKNEAGIYTILFWIRRVPSDKGFPAGQVCIVSQA
jgi:Uncharacterized protein with SCP/PR1 domains